MSCMHNEQRIQNSLSGLGLSPTVFSCIGNIFKGITVVLCVVVLLASSVCYYAYVVEFERVYIISLRIHTEAADYLHEGICTDPEKRSKYNAFNLCVQAENTVAIDPKTEAAHTAFMNTFGCSSSGGWCTRVYDDIHSLVRMVILVLALCVTYLGWFYIGITREERRYNTECYRLPMAFTHQKKLI